MEPEKKIVKFPVWDLDIDEIVELEMDEESYNAMLAAEKEQDDWEKKVMKEQQEEDWRLLKIAIRRKDDDD